MAGRVGRPATPSKVVSLRGGDVRRAASVQLDEFSPDPALARLPAWVTGEARKEYLRVGEQLDRYGIVSEIDRGALVMMASEWARVVWAEQKIAELNKADPKGEAGLVAKTPNDYAVVSVYEQIRRAAMTSYLKLASEFGLTPSSRTRIRPGSPQLALPGMDGNEGGDEAPSLRSFA